MKLKECTLSANTGLDAIKRAPIVEYDTGVKCIRIQDISQKKEYDEWGNTEVSPSDYRKFKLNLNDILIARTGATVGVSYIVKQEYNSVYNNGSIRLRFSEKVDTDYVYYNLQTKEFLSYIDNISCVATQPNLRIEGLLRYNIPEFKIDYQKRISRILLIYDELIEVNNKRIKILEQTSEELYKEWFVRFRFPGHETAQFEDGLPKGWIFGENIYSQKPKNWYYGKLSELGSFVRGKNITSDKMIYGDIPVISAGIEPSGYHNESNVKGASLTISASGANAGYLKYNLSDIWAADCSFYQNDDNIWFVYSALNFINKVLSNLQVGAAQPHVYPKHINRLCVIIPEEKYIKQYNEIAETIFAEIKSIKQQNENLIKQRDLLLPRLMSGKLEV